MSIAAVALVRATAAMAEAPQLCGLHLLRFETVEEFPEETPDFSDIIGGFAAQRCQSKCIARNGARAQVPLCAEDVEATNAPELFDSRGFLIGVCPRHARAVFARAVEGRACTGAGCSSSAEADEQSPTPNVGRVVIGTRLYCTTCAAAVNHTGKTPARPVRTAMADDGEDSDTMDPTNSLMRRSFS